MTRASYVTATALFLFALSMTTSAQRGGGAPAAPPLVRENATEKISDHVYVIPDNNVGMVPNIGIIVGSRGTFVVDTGLGNRNGQTVTRELQKVSKTPELYLGTTERLVAAHRFYEKNGFVQVAPESLPKAFPRMSLDTRFYYRALA